MFDLRSDTVTKPTDMMRKAMANAEVGDDVYGDDPTINKLEKLGAKILGKPTALFVPSGTFGNQLALFTWCQRGSEVLLGEECHIIQHEAGGAAVIAGVQTRPVPAPSGQLSVNALEERLRKQDLHAPFTSLICVENAHSSGKVVPVQHMKEIYKVAKKWGLPVHLDGARLFNAATALGCSAEEIAGQADSVMICLSKGLCAPVGSLLAGPKKFVAQARLKRKILGGGMRQAGVLAAAGLLALNDHRALLQRDHQRAAKLSRGLAKIPGIKINPRDTEINMVFFSWSKAANKKIADHVVKIFLKNRIIINPPDNKGLFRFVTHYWIGDNEVDSIIKASQEAFK